MPVVVVEYDPTWPVRFDALKRLLVVTLGPAAVAVEHVGSTAVPGLAAKPIIDIDVALADFSNAHELRSALEAAGFRRALVGDFPDRQWYVRDEAGRRTCHLSLTYLESETWLSHRALRDRLLTDPAARREYGDLKRRLAAEHDDAEAYTDAKTAVIQRLLGTGWRSPPSRQPLVSHRLLVIGGLALLAVVGTIAWIAHYADTSRGPDGLPDHRPIRAADLTPRPEARLFYPGSTPLQTARSDESTDPNNPASAPARLGTLLAAPVTPEAIKAWYSERLNAAGWRLSASSLTGEVPAGEVDTEWRRGSREFFDLKLYVDRTSLGSQRYAIAGLIYQVVYLAGTGR